MRRKVERNSDYAIGISCNQSERSARGHVEEERTHTAVSVVIKTVLEEINNVFLQILLHRIPLPVYGLQPSLRELYSHLAATQRERRNIGKDDISEQRKRSNNASKRETQRERER